MGWWVADPESGGMAELRNAGPEDALTKPMWGDVPADIFGEALDGIVEQFEADLGRRPSKAELRAGLEFSLGPYQE
jgi:hypothetical protein